MKPIQPIVGISARRLRPPGRHEWFYGAFGSYVECVEQAGGAVAIVTDGQAAIIDRLDALLLTGGGDLANPSYWSSGEPNGDVDRERDEREVELVLRAKDKGLPVLAICRGAQLANCALGGSIARMLPSGMYQHVSQSGEHIRHKVTIASKSTLGLLYPSVEMDVVSRHQVGIDRLGAGLVPVAWAADGTIECIECGAWPFLGTQWHPEWRDEGRDPDLSLFRWLIEKTQHGLQS